MVSAKQSLLLLSALSGFGITTAAPIEGRGLFDIFTGGSSDSDSKGSGPLGMGILPDTGFGIQDLASSSSISDVAGGLTGGLLGSGSHAASKHDDDDDHHSSSHSNHSSSNDDDDDSHHSSSKSPQPQASSQSQSQTQSQSQSHSSSKKSSKPKCDLQAKGSQSLSDDQINVFVSTLKNGVGPITYSSMCAQIGALPYLSKDNAKTLNKAFDSAKIEKPEEGAFTSDEEQQYVAAIKKMAPANAQQAVANLLKAPGISSKETQLFQSAASQAGN